jgi:hypothetical protein
MKNAIVERWCKVGSIGACLVVVFMPMFAAAGTSTCAIRNGKIVGGEN